MRLKSISLRNFKSFQELDIDLSKINIIIGPNNSGKSNILRSLLLLGQTYTSSTTSPLLLNGRFLNLGSFKRTTHKYNSEPIQFEITAENREPYRLDEKDSSKLVIEKKHYITHKDKIKLTRNSRLCFKISFVYLKEKRRIEIKNFEIRDTRSDRVILRIEDSEIIILNDQKI